MPNEADDPRRDDLLDRRSFVGIAALLPFMLARPSRGETAAQVGSVEDLKGQAFAEKDAVRRELDRTAALFVRDQVGTGATRG